MLTHRWARLAGAALVAGLLGTAAQIASAQDAAGTPSELRNIKDTPRQSLPPDPPSVRGDRVRRIPVDSLRDIPSSDARNRLERDGDPIPYSPRASSSATTPSRRAIENAEYWNRYSTWYDGEYAPYYYRRNSRYYHADAPVADQAPPPPRYDLLKYNPVRSTSPGNRNRYYFYETDRRFNPVPMNGAGHNYNIVY